MSAEALREAAWLMRKRAKRAEVAYRGAPEAQTIAVADELGDHLEAFGHPAVALAVADWLDAEAVDLERIGDESAHGPGVIDFIVGNHGGDLHPALAVARALGETS